MCWSAFCNRSLSYLGKGCLQYHCLNDDTRICWASQETFTTGFEDKYGMRHITREEEIPHGKRKCSDPAGQFSAKLFHTTGTYSARTMQALTATFANPARTASLTPERAKGEAAAAQWTCGQVPLLEPTVEGVDRKNSQLAYARTLLTVFQEAVSQLAVVVEKFEQIQAEEELRAARIHSWLPPKSKHRTKTKLLRQANSSRTPISKHAQHVPGT